MPTYRDADASTYRDADAPVSANKPVKQSNRFKAWLNRNQVRLGPLPLLIIWALLGLWSFGHIYFNWK